MNYETLYLTSGGTNGYVYIGALQILERKNLLKNLKRVIGCSVGSIFSLFYILGYKSKDILKILTLQNVEDIYINQKVNNDNIILNLTMNLGLNDGNGIIRLINIFLEHKNISNNITLKELYKIYPIEFIILVSNITNNKQELISYKTNGDMPVNLAIRASCSIPLLFTPIKYKDNIFVDGGFITDMKSNFIDEKTLILRLHTSKYYETNDSLGNIFDYIKTIFQTILMQTQFYNKNSNTIEYNFNSSGINFTLTNDDKIKLYYKGIKDTLDFINNKKLKIKYFLILKNFVKENKIKNVSS